MVNKKLRNGSPYEMSMAYQKLKSGVLYGLLPVYGLIFFHFLGQRMN